MGLSGLFQGKNRRTVQATRNEGVVYFLEIHSPASVVVSPMKRFLLFPGERYLQATFVLGCLDELVTQDCKVLSGRDDVEHRGVAIHTVYRSIATYFGDVESLESQFRDSNVDKRFIKPLGLTRLRTYERTLQERRKKTTDITMAMHAASDAYWK